MSCYTDDRGNMKKVLDNVHILIDNNLGQDYVFDGCLAYLMECLGESNTYDYWFFSGVSGDSYTQIYQQDLDKLTQDFSHACFDDDLLKRVFRAVGYGYSYVTGSALKGNLDTYRRQVVDSIDQGVPVIAKGFDFPLPPWRGKTYQNIDIGCIVGYENEGETLLYISQDSVIPSPHMANDSLILRPFVLDPSYCLVFAGKKKPAPPLANVYTEAIWNIPRLNKMPERDGIFLERKRLNSGRPTWKMENSIRFQRINWIFGPTMGAIWSFSIPIYSASISHNARLRFVRN